MKRFLFIVLFFQFLFLKTNIIFGQPYFVIGNTSAAFLKINGGVSGAPAYFVVGNSGTNAIRYTDALARKSWIISEGQYNYVRWASGATTGNYVLPFGYSTTDSIPIYFNKTAGTATITASTWKTTSDNMPHSALSDNGTAACWIMKGPGGADSLTSAVDRWWDINATGATAAITFSYRQAENVAPISSPSSNVYPQRWIGVSPWWSAQLSTGTAGVASANAVGTSSSGSISSFGPFVLTHGALPLPVEWLNISTDCENGKTEIKWSTATEQNTDYFTVEKSFDGNNFTAFATVSAAGNSNVVKNYSVIDADAYSGTTFYRVQETDFNGAFIYSATVSSANCAGSSIAVNGAGDEILIAINALEDGQFIFDIYDLLGQKVSREIKNVAQGNNYFKLDSRQLASAIYIVKIYNNNTAVSKKVFIRSTI